MKKVVLLYSKNLTDPTGASAVIRILNDNIPLFQQNNIHLSVYSRDRFVQTNQMEKSHSWLGNVKLKISDFLANTAKTNSLAAYLSIYIKSIRPAKKLVNYYLKQAEDAKIVFIHEIFTCYEYIKRRKTHNKIIFVMHSNGETFKMERIYYKNFAKSCFYRHLLQIERTVLSNIDKIGFVASMPTGHFKNLHPDFLPGNVFYVYNGLPSCCSKRNFASDKRNIEISCIGTVNERKGQRFIVETLNILNTTGSLPEIHFTIIGDGAIKNELEILVKKYNIEKYISFIGNSNKVTEYLLQSDIFILPSLDEGFPIAILEAMRASLPIVSTKVGGIPEMLENGVNGIFIDPSTKGVCDFISNINNYDWKAMGEKSYQIFLEKFTVKTMIDSYSSVMNQLS